MVVGMTPEHEAQRGEQAARLLSDPLLIEILDAIEAKWTTAWKDSPARDADGRELAYLMLKSAQLFREELNATVDRGKVAKATLAQRAGQTLRRIWAA